MQPTNDSLRPTAQLLAAAFAGLLSGSGCGDDASNQGTTAPTTTSAPSNTQTTLHQPTTPVGTQPTTTRPDTTMSSEPSNGSSTSQTGKDCNKIPTITESIKGVRTYASLTQECDQLGGLIQLHAACGGVNACAGFSYGDWGENSMLTRHDCAGANGCNGLSCVVLPKDQNRKPEDILLEKQPEGQPIACKSCHLEWTDNGPDLSKFKIYVPPGSTRNASNWLDLSKDAQVKIIAFGKSMHLPDGTLAANMRGYHKKYSRAEIERLVDFIRTRTVVVKPVRTKDE